MRRHLLAAVAVVLVALVPVGAQAPAGWKVRADRSTSASDPDGAGAIQFTSIADGVHAVTPQAAVFWRPTSTATGAYSLKGTFTLMKPSGHTNYYGLVFGGSDLDGPGQTYVYFMVAQDGTWLVKQRSSDTTTQNVSPKTSSDAVKKPDATGMSTNALEVRVTTDKIEYFVNGTSVYTSAKTGLTAKTDGLYGIRINHLLDVQVTNFTLTKQ